MNALELKTARTFNTLEIAFHASLEESGSDTVWIVAGSFYTVAEVWHLLTGGWQAGTLVGSGYTYLEASCQSRTKVQMIKV
jgi:hypothetical protein